MSLLDETAIEIAEASWIIGHHVEHLCMWWPVAESIRFSEKRRDLWPHITPQNFVLAHVHTRKHVWEEGTCLDIVTQSLYQGRNKQSAYIQNADSPLPLKYARKWPGVATSVPRKINGHAVQSDMYWRKKLRRKDEIESFKST